MGRMYTAVVSASAVTAAVDIFEIVGAADSLTVVHGWTVSQSTEVGDSQEEGLELTAARGEGATSGSGGSSGTAVPVNAGDAAFGGTVEIVNTTQASAGGGSLTETESHNWNIRVPFAMIYTPETRPVISPGDMWVLRTTAPADSTTISATIWVEEIGG